MGTTTNGQLCYGVAFEEGFEFPWGDEDIEDWWACTVHGFKPSFELYDARGAYLNGREPSREETSRYHKERRDFDAAHPLPVKLVNYCSSEYPMLVIAVPRTVRSASRGNPAAIDPAALVVSEDERAGLLKFLGDHDIDAPDAPAWLLTSYWG